MPSSATNIGAIVRPLAVLWTSGLGEALHDADRNAGATDTSARKSDTQAVRHQSPRLAVEFKVDGYMASVALVGDLLLLFFEYFGEIVSSG